MEQTKRVDAFRTRQDFEYKEFVTKERAKEVNKRQTYKAWIAGGLVGAILVLIFQIIVLITW